MIKRFFLACVFCLVAFSAKAEEKSFENFSIDLTPGWQLMGEPVNEEGTEVAIFGNTENGAAVLLTFFPSGGLELKAAVERSQEMLKDQGVNLEVVSVSDRLAVYQGKQGPADIRMFIAVDPEAEKVGTMVYTGNVDAADEIGKTVVIKNAKIFFRE